MKARQLPAPDKPSTGSKRGAKTARQWTQKLAAAMRDFEFWEGRFLARWPRDVWPTPMVMSYDRFRRLLREARRAHPGHVFGYIEEAV